MDWLTPQLGCLLFIAIAPIVWAYSFYKMVLKMLREQREEWRRDWEERHK